MRALTIGFSLLFSFSVFAQDSLCVEQVSQELFNTVSVSERISTLLTDLTTIDNDGQIIVNEDIKLQIEEVQKSVINLANTICAE